MAQKKTPKLRPLKTRFAGYPAAQAYEASDGKKKVKEGGQLPWGFVVYDTGKRGGSYKAKDSHGKVRTGKYAACHRRNRSGGVERGKTVWFREHELQDERCLEVVFVDIGQGDGCYVVTPDNKRMVIDAGEAGNMRHYLNWRHGSSKKTTFEAGIISHPDSDHYRGFAALFERKNFVFENIYTNGLMEWAVPKKKGPKTGPQPSALGPKQKLLCDDGEARSLVTRLVTTKKELKTFLADKGNWQTKKVGKDGKERISLKQFPAMINDALEGRKVVQRRAKKGEKKDPPPEISKGKTMGDFRMLSEDDGFLPGYGEDDKLTIRVLGPVTDKVQGKRMLRWLDSNVGKTKNGHSVVLRLQYKNVSMMLGGDLNIPSEHLLLSHHTGMTSPPDTEHEAAFIAAARQVFQVDIAKSCHHGSSDFTPWFLRALNPIATVISSGDNEPHSHPRSDTLGAIGFYSRSQPRPLIFSTELARSSKDSNQKPWELRSEIMKEVDKILKAKPGPKQDARRKKLEDKLAKDIPRSVAVYGAITVVTDGEKVVIYQKLERRGAHGAYDMYLLESSGKDGSGPLIYQSKH